MKNRLPITDWSRLDYREETDALPLNRAAVVMASASAESESLLA